MAAHMLIGSIHSHPRGDWRRDVDKDEYRDKMMDGKIKEIETEKFICYGGRRYGQNNTVADMNNNFCFVSHFLLQCLRRTDSEKVFFLLFTT